MGETRKKSIRVCSIAMIVLVLVFCAVLLKGFRNGNFNSVESLQNYISGFGAWAPLALTVFQALQVIIPVLPGFLGCAAGSILFGPFVGFLCNYIGISVGSVIAFYLARCFGMPLLQDLFPNGKYTKWFDKAARSKSYAAFLFMAMVLPLFPDDYLCYLSGVMPVKARRFIWIIVLGKPWCILAYSLGFGMIR